MTRSRCDLSESSRWTARSRDLSESSGARRVLVLEGVSLDDVRSRMHAQPFVVEDLMTLEYEEIYEM
jgi:hypothetical protein